MFDTVVVTAANAAQAKGYREQIKWRCDKGMLPEGLEVIVVADPGGKRVGSLGATVNVLKKLKDACGKKIFICHSGGDARRTPAYAAMGKAFTPMPTTGGIALFDLILRNMGKIAMPKSGGVLVACGDVLLTFDFKAVDFSKPGVTGVGYRDGAQRAAKHGVYLVKAKSKGVNKKVEGFLQKPKFDGGRHVIDTGIMWIDWPTAQKMVKSGWKNGDLYQDFTTSLLEGFADFSVNVVPKCDFFHIGSSRELLKCMTSESATSKFYGFDIKNPNLVGKDIFAADTENIVSSLPLDMERTVSLRKGECVTFLPIGKSDWVKVPYGIDDNFKEDGKWEKKIFRHAGKRISLKELMPKVNHRRLLAERGL
ncbi:MAG: hypothetical protein J6R18_09930 [Kiritimatiellae bacterium]|nr:hypothetical protein [Kiritimatiellia bacterium]